MLDHLLDQFRNNNDQEVNPWLTAAATYLGSELLHHHGNEDNNENGENDHRSHFWRNAALTGALAYGLNKYQEHQQQQQQQEQQEQSHQAQQLATENYYYPSSSYVPYSSYYSQPNYYYQQPYYQNQMFYSPYYMNGSMPVTMNPYIRQGYPSFMLQQTPYFYGNNFQTPQPRFLGHHHYTSFSPYHRPHQYRMIPYRQTLPYRYMC